MVNQSAAEAAAATSAAAEMRRLEEKERRIDEAIAEELQKRKPEVSARAKGRWW
jgi:hypothetical protein